MEDEDDYQNESRSYTWQNVKVIVINCDLKIASKDKTELVIKLLIKMTL